MIRKNKVRTRLSI